MDACYVSTCTPQNTKFVPKLIPCQARGEEGVISLNVQELVQWSVKLHALSCCS